MFDLGMGFETLLSGMSQSEKDICLNIAFKKSLGIFRTLCL